MSKPTSLDVHAAMRQAFEDEFERAWKEHYRDVEYAEWIEAAGKSL